MRKGSEYSGIIDFLIYTYFLFSLSFVTREANYKLPMFSKAYGCIVEAQYTYMKLTKIIFISIPFVNLSMSALEAFDSSPDSVMTMMDDSGFDNNSRNKMKKKIINLFVRLTYYIFCRRNKAGTNPELLEFWKHPLTNFSLFHFFLFHFMLISIICLNRRSNNRLPVIS